MEKEHQVGPTLEQPNIPNSSENLHNNVSKYIQKGLNHCLIECMIKSSTVMDKA